MPDRSRARTSGLLLLAGLSLAACGDITRVADPSAILPSNTQNPSGAAELRTGALGQIFFGFSEQALYTGVFTDEFTSAPEGGTPEDQRALGPTDNGDYGFPALSSGRLDAFIAIHALEQYAPTPAWHIGELYALIGATEILFSENLCSPVPLGIVTGDMPEHGPTLTRSALIAHALEELDSAAAYATGSDSVLSLIAVLRGRALLDSGATAAAAAAVATVPPAFAYAAEQGGPLANNNNQIYLRSSEQQLISISDREGINGLPFVSAVDPRVPTLNVTGQSSVPVIIPAAISSGSTPLILASGVEAQLIGAEAALQAGNVAQWSATLNGLRQTAIAPAMSSLPSDSTINAPAAMRLAVMFRERAFWLFATGHRHGDLRRLVRQYGLSPNSVFPTGVYNGGPQLYGSSVVYGIDEIGNPNYTGCQDLGA